MRIYPLGLCVFSALIPLAAASAAPAPATILIGGRVVPFQVKPFVGPDGQVLAPVDAVQLLGAKYTPNTNGTVTVTSASGRQFTTPYTPVQGRYCVPFQKVATALGGAADWQPTTATLTVRARLQMVRQDDKTLTIYTSYPIYYSVKRIDAPERLYVDLFGLDLATTPANIPSTDGDVTHIRSGQINPQTVRITIDLKHGMSFQVLSGIQASAVKVALGTGSPVSPRPVPVLPPAPVVNPPVASLPAHPGPVTITNVDYKVVSPALTQITVTTTGPAKYRTEALDNPHRLAFDLAGAALAQGLSAIQSVNDPVIKSIRVGKLLTPQTPFGRVVLDLSRLVGFSVDSRPAEGGGMNYILNVVTTDPSAPVAAVPPVAPVAPYLPSVPTNASLAGKIIVVDPGHGGKDTGAPAQLRPYDVYEKDITLAIGLRLRDMLRQNGATVLMTRSDDSFPPLVSRAPFANDHHADYFISIHADSSVAGRNSLSGSTVYFHGSNSLCRLMAMDIGRRVSQTSGIPYNGVKSDTIRFRTGFAVLRGSAMPAVLVETGYMNNDRDLQTLRDDAGQQKIAEGITAGLRDFIADQIRLLHSARAQSLPGVPQVMPAAVQSDSSPQAPDDSNSDTADTEKAPN